MGRKNNDGRQEQELLWLLKHEVPVVMFYLDNLINTCLKFALNKASNKFKLSCTSSTSTVEALRGNALLHQDTLCSMEMFIKPNKTVATIKASFRSDKQWKLQQIQDSYNHIREVSRVLETMKHCHAPCTPDAVVSTLDSIIKHLTRCQSRLMLPCQLSLSSLIGSGFTKMFAPPLPGDTLMNSYVIEDRLVVTHYTVQQAHLNASLNANKGGKLNHNPVAGRALFHDVGSIMEYSGARYEVSTANKAECVIPVLTNLLQTASSALVQCQSLKDKFMKLSWPLYC
ncbi:protein rogdi homolog [Clavelina lepadiformis]|uniref:Protein rogdi homolog n=1 Tax=Clavelina lepadiformis TaxID=159417 RepID=A0ABP0GQM0_CLALP